MTWTTDKPTQHLPDVQWNRETKSWDRVLERIMAKVEMVTESGCWIWMGADKGDEQYGVVYFCGRRFHVHTLLYKLLVGPIPQGLVPDHLCRVRLCVNPSHLEPVTDAVNIQRGHAVRVKQRHGYHGHWAGPLEPPT